MRANDISGFSNANLSIINSRRPGKLRIDQESMNYVVQVEGEFSKIRRILDSRRPVTTTADQGLGQWGRAT